MAAVKNSYTLGPTSLFETGFAAFHVAHRRTPQGTALYTFSGQGRSGNFFTTSREAGSREQGFINFYPPSFRFWGRHQFQMGGDVQHLTYDAGFERRPFQTLNSAGQVTTLTSFVGPGVFREANFLSSAYLHDRWRPTERLMLSLGIRQDWDRFVGRNVISPRAAFAWTPFANARTKISGGYGVFYDASQLATLSRPLDQVSVTVPFAPNGDPGVAFSRVFVPGERLALPRFGNWTASVEREVGRRITAQVEWIRKRGRDGFVYAQLPGADRVPLSSVPGGFAEQSALGLTNLRRDIYDEVAVTVRQSFGEQYEWFVSYVRSRAASNAVLDIRVDQVFQTNNNTGRMPWDAPNRLMTWGYVPIPIQKGKWALAYLLDWRSGFPFAVIRDTGEIVGAPDSHRFPTNFSLNLHVERRLEFRGRRFALRLGVNNVTGHQNPSSVFNVIGSPRFLQFTGQEGRHVVVRLRFFGNRT
jgi:hypothetical protein